MGDVILEKGTLKLAKAKATTSSGVATILLKVPGTPGSGDGRLIESGYGWFLIPHADDYAEVYVSDEDNILGYGAGAIVGSYTDTDVPSANKGWYFPKPDPTLRVDALAGIGFINAGLYLKIIATKGDLSSDTFMVNLKWGVRD